MSKIGVKALSAEQETQVCDLWEEGMRVVEIAEAFGVHRQTIYRTLFDRGEVERQHRPYRAGYRLSETTRILQSDGARRAWEERRRKVAAAAGGRVTDE